MKDFNFNAPINSVSFGSVSIAILRELFKRNIIPSIFPIGGQMDLSAQKPDEEFNKNLQLGLNKSLTHSSRKNHSFRLWHMNGSMESYSNLGNDFLTFHETDGLTNVEINVLRNQNKVYVTNSYTQNVFKMFEINSVLMPLGFDSHNFYSLSRRPTLSGTITFGLFGKAEKRKSTYKVLNLWSKKYGNNINYRLNCAIHNPFLSEKDHNTLISQALEGKTYSNITFLPWSPTNAEYNSVLQSCDIVLCMSGAEGYGLPEYHATALGAWPVALKAHAYTDFFNEANAVLVNPNGKTPAVDSIFFHPNQPFNQGNFFTFADEDFYKGCEEAEQRFKTSGINSKGMELQKQTYAQTVDVLLNS